MDFSKIFKVVDTVVSVLEPRKSEARENGPEGSPQSAPPSFADQMEMRLTNVVVAALKEAFDRDNTRLELERARIEEERRRAEEERRRAEEAARLELERQAIDREIARLRLLAGAALVGWLASVAVLVMRIQTASNASRGVLIAGSAILLASLGAAFAAQAQLGSTAQQRERQRQNGAASGSLWLLLAGLAIAAASLLF